MSRFLIAMGMAFLAAACSATIGGPNDLIITNVVIISPERDDPSEVMDVLIRAGRIARIDRNIKTGDGFAGRKIDGEGRLLTPGLIDGHTHLGEIPGMIFEHEAAHPEIARRAHRQIPRSYLYHGFTTVIDLNARPETIADWNARALRPKAYFCGASPVFDGYPMSWTPKPARYELMPYFLYDASRSDAFPAGFDPEEHSPDAIVTKMRGDGAICVKTHYERGFGGRGDLPVPHVDLIRDLVSAAHASDMPVLLHANSQSAQQFGNSAGVDAFAHGMWTWDDRSKTKLTAEIASIIDTAIKQEIALQPTIQVLYGERDLHDPDYLSRPELRDVLPQSLIEWYSTTDGQWWRDRMAAIPFISEMIKDGRWAELDAEPIARVTAALSHFAANGGLLVFGSDTPSDPTFANPPGLNGRLEMNNWIAAGVTPSALFRAATLGNAEFFGLQQDLGSVETGKKANLLFMTANPTESIAAYDTIEIVILEGEVLPRSTLSARASE